MVWRLIKISWRSRHPVLSGFGAAVGAAIGFAIFSNLYGFTMPTHPRHRHCHHSKHYHRQLRFKGHRTRSSFRVRPSQREPTHLSGGGLLGPVGPRGKPSQGQRLSLAHPSKLDPPAAGRWPRLMKDRSDYIILETGRRSISLSCSERLKREDFAQQGWA
jgi:hypothetical protein